MMEKISDSHAQSVCLIGQRKETCSFLTVGSGGWECLKGSNFEKAIRIRQPQMRSKGDNCSGPPNFVEK